MTIKKGSLNAIIGTIGSGKTSLFMAILKEIPYKEGSIIISIKNPIVAFVEQESAIFSGTIKELITFGNKYDELKLERVIEASNL